MRRSILAILRPLGLKPTQKVPFTRRARQQFFKAEAMGVVRVGFNVKGDT